MTAAEPTHVIVKATGLEQRSALRTLALYLAVAILVSTPCFWQRHIQADDLSSHLYNAWLVNEVQAGRLQGLYVVTQYTNVLFDHMLSFLLKHTASVVATERIAVSIAVQIFFWGCFFLTSTVAKRPAWSVAPFLAMLSYGAVFRIGFFNFYISLALCLWSIGLILQNRPHIRWITISLLALAYVAHSLPVVWAVGVCAYIIVGRRVSRAKRLWLLLMGLVAVGGVLGALSRTFPCGWLPVLPIPASLGLDQVCLFGPKYKFIAAGLAATWLLLFVYRLHNPRAVLQDIPFHLWVFSVVTCFVMPVEIWMPPYEAAFTYITIRLSLLSAVLFCAVVAPLHLTRFEYALGLTLCIVFFSFSYVDERALNHVESRLEQATALLPMGARVIAPLKDPDTFVPAMEHLVDRPCIGHCFSFANYEPSTTQFRLRAAADTTYTLTNLDEVSDFEQGKYAFRREDVPVYLLFACPAAKGFCSRALAFGEHVVRQRIRPAQHWWSLPSEARAGQRPRTLPPNTPSADVPE